MRIAFIHPRYPFSDGTGATHSATRIVSGLVAVGHNVRVYCPRKPDGKVQSSNLELRHLTGNSSHPHTTTRLNKEISARIDEFREFDIAHSYLMGLIPSIGEIGEKTDTNTVVTLNAYGGICAKNDLLYRDKIRCERKSTRKCLNCITRSGFNTDTSYLYETTSQALSLRLINCSDRVQQYIDGYQALSTHVKDTYATFGYNRDKIETIPNILDEKFDINHTSDFVEPIQLLYVGYLKKHKGVDRLLDVISQVNARDERQFQLTIVGDGELRESLEQERLNRGLRDVVELKGRIPNDELPSVYASHDIFLYPGRWDEPFGRIFLEAMAAGVPIVTTDVGSVKEIIGDAGVVTKGDINGLVDGVISVSEASELQTRSEEGKKKIYEYKLDSVIPQFEEFYRSLIC